MRLTKTLIAVALAATTATSAIAGGLAPTGPEVQVIPVQPEPQRSSWGIILPILGAVLLIGLATSGGSDDEEDEG